MTPDLLIETGTALYPTGWMAGLSGDLNVHDRTIRRWLAGVNRIPPNIATELVALVQKRRGDLAAIENKLLGVM